MGRPLRVLFVEDLEDDALLLARKLSQAGFDPVYERVEDYEGMKEALERGEWDIVISDYVIPRFSGPAALRLLQDMGRDIPFIVISGTVGEDVAVEMVKAGADDYLMKDNLARFVPAVERSLREAELRRRGKRTEGALRESEERYRELAEAIGDVFFAIDGELRCTYWNRASEELTGISTREAIGRSLFELFPDVRGTLVEESYRESLRTRSARSFEYEISIRGSAYWFEVHAYPTSSGLAVFARDVTGRRRSQERLARLSQCLLNLGSDPEENIAGIVKEVPGIVGGRMAKYWRSEGEAYSLFASHADLPGYEHLPAALDRKDIETAFMWHVGPIADGAGGPGGDVASLDPDVSTFRLGSLLGHPVMLGEEIIGCLCLFDVTERDFSREEIDLMGMLSRALSIEEERWFNEMGLRNFIEITSHELRHPITLMKGYAVTLREMRDVLESERCDELLEAIDRGADRLADLLKELLDSSRIERGSFTVTRREVDFRGLVQSALREVEERHPARKFVVRMGDECLELKADPRRVVQLLTALLDNAAKFSPPWSEVEIEVIRDLDELAVSVMDRGEGIPPGERDRIFRRFYQLGDVRHHSIPGIGLGLYIARKIVESHQGRIWYEPRKGGGSAFHFTLPLSRPLPGPP